jgi:hypothetical protein
MRKRRVWLWLLGFVVLIGLIVACLYESTTHIGRGWLRGEAFYDGWPTSYWAQRCDEWLDRFDDKESLVQFTWMLPVEFPNREGLCAFGIPDDLNVQGRGGLAMPRETTWKRIRDSLHSRADLKRQADYYFAPKILWGTPDTQPVLEELARDEKYHLLATLALRRVKSYCALKEEMDHEPAD